MDDAPRSPGPANVAEFWVEFTVAMAMDFRREPLDRDRRQALTQEILGRWRGNRRDVPAATGADSAALFETTIRWVVENTGIDVNPSRWPGT